MVANGPDTTPVRSRTRTPLSGPGMGQLPVYSCFRSGVRICHSIRTVPLLGRLGNRFPGLLDNRLLDVAELILAEEHFLSNEEGRRAKGSPADRIVGQIDQPFLDVILLRAGDKSVDIDSR